MRCVGDIEPGYTEDAARAVVLVDGAGGGELAALAETLSGCLRTPTVLIRREDLASRAFVLEPGRGVLEVDGRALRPAVVWTRHCSAGALGVHGGPAGAGDPLAAQAWSGFLRQLEGLAARVLPGPAPAGPAQLPDAARHGFRVPRTVLTTDVAAAARRIDAPRVIVKTPDFRLYTADRGAWPALAPVVLERDEARAHVPGARPVVVQEHLANARELRVYYLDQGLCAFEVHAAVPGHMWTRPDAVRVERTACPPAVERAVRRLCAAWGLRYGAFDLLVPDRGAPWFLEANPDGDWLWFERRAGWPAVSFLAAVMVRELYVRSGS
jgi:hypothetical protein